MSDSEKAQTKAEIGHAIETAINALALETKEGMIEAHG